MESHVARLLYRGAASFLYVTNLPGKLMRRDHVGERANVPPAWLDPVTAFDPWLVAQPLLNGNYIPTRHTYRVDYAMAAVRGIMHLFPAWIAAVATEPVPHTRFRDFLFVCRAHIDMAAIAPPDGQDDILPGPAFVALAAVLEQSDPGYWALIMADAPTAMFALPGASMTRCLALLVDLHRQSKLHVHFEYRDTLPLAAAQQILALPVAMGVAQVVARARPYCDVLVKELELLPDKQGIRVGVVMPYAADGDAAVEYVRFSRSAYDGHDTKRMFQHDKGASHFASVYLIEEPCARRCVTLGVWLPLPPQATDAPREAPTLAHSAILAALCAWPQLTPEKRQAIETLTRTSIFKPRVAKRVRDGDDGDDADAPWAKMPRLDAFYES